MHLVQTGDWWLALLAGRLWDATTARRIDPATAACCMTDMAALGYAPPAGWVQATMKLLEEGEGGLLSVACVACVADCLGDVEEATLQAVARAAAQVRRRRV